MNLSDLKAIRKAQKIKITDVSRKTGIHRDRISSIERGLGNPHFNTIIAIADAINAKITITHEKGN